MTRGEQALFLLAGKIPPGPPFFKVAAQALATRADCRWAGVGELRDDGRSVDLLAFWDRDHQAEPFSFQLEGSPCLQVYRSKPDDPHQFFPCDVANRFADFPLLAQIGARSYRGEVFHDSVERPIGHVFVISEKDEADDEGLREFFRLVAQRVGSEYNRWRAEEALARSEKTLRWYESMAATTSDRMALIDTSYTYRAVNSSYLKSAPYRSPKDRIRAREDVVGQTIDEILEPTFARQVVRRNLDRCFAGHSFNLEGWVQGPGHQSRYLQRSFRPYRSEEGTILGAVVTVRDLTRRQQQLAKINRLAVHEAVAAGDLFAAARQITEEATDLLGVEGASIWQRSGEPGKLRCLAKFDRSRRAHSSDSTVQLETSSSAYETLSSGLPIIEHDLAEPQGGEAPRAAGEVTSRLRVPIRVSGELVGLARFDHVGPPRIWQADEINFACEAAFLVVQTISRRDRRLMDVLQAKNAELEARSTELESFTYAVSHDLKSPLFTIKGFLGALERDIAEGNQERIARDIGRIHSAAGTMQLLLDELLELTQIGRVEIAPVAVPLSDLAHEAIELLSRQISERGVHINIAADLPIAYGDRLRLLQMLQNLIENAVKFMGDQVDPQIEIARRDEGSETVCVVRDNGQGIAPRYCEKIFGLFERLDADSPGTGIGLAIVARIVNLHDGRIWAESEGPGRGSSFCFALPWKS